MFNRSFLSILIVTSAFTFVFGQTPEAKKEKEKAMQSFAFAFEGDGGYLGVQTQEVNKENFAKFGLRDVRGVAVEKVFENSPAAAAGIQNGDVIVRFNAEEITSTRKLTRLISEVAPDHQVKLTVARGGSEQEINATIGKRPMQKFEGGNFNFSTPAPMGNLDRYKELLTLKDLPEMKNFPKGEGQNFVWRPGEGRHIGIVVTSLSKQLADHFGVESGVMISDVRENSPASKAGLKAGDIIVDVDGKPVKGDFDLIRAINEKKEGDVALAISRDGKRQTISVTPEASKDSGFMFRNEDDVDIPSVPAPAAMPTGRLTPPVTPLLPARVITLRGGRII
ncbi:MAG: PDZ domain-containing protein [Pyrinomonadaceae bacterium]